MAFVEAAVEMVARVTGPEQHGWGAYERLVLAKLDELAADIKEIQATQGRQSIDIAMLKVKAGMWGAVAGLVPFALYVAYALLSGGGS